MAIRMFRRLLALAAALDVRVDYPVSAVVASGKN